jgi:hypothetical protein
LWPLTMELRVFPSPVASALQSEREGGRNPGIGHGVSGDNKLMGGPEEGEPGTCWDNAFNSVTMAPLLFSDASCYVRGTYQYAVRPRRKTLPRVLYLSNFSGVTCEGLNPGTTWLPTPTHRLLPKG